MQFATGEIRRAWMNQEFERGNGVIFLTANLVQNAMFVNVP